MSNRHILDIIAGVVTLYGAMVFVTAYDFGFLAEDSPSVFLPTLFVWVSMVISMCVLLTALFHHESKV